MLACRSAIATLLLGMAGQVAYHLLTQAGTTHAPWKSPPPYRAYPSMGKSGKPR
jgi:hypothetical protein